MLQYVMSRARQLRGTDEVKCVLHQVQQQQSHHPFLVEMKLTNLYTVS